MGKEHCNICSGELNSWDKHISKVLAYKLPVCEACIAAEYGMGQDEQLSLSAWMKL